MSGRKYSPTCGLAIGAVIGALLWVLILLPFIGGK